MNLASFIALAIGFLFVVGVPILLYLHQRTYIDPMKRSIEWQFEKARKLGEGWLPYAYRHVECDEEAPARLPALLPDERSES